MRIRLLSRLRCNIRLVLRLTGALIGVCIVIAVGAYLIEGALEAHPEKELANALRGWELRFQEIQTADAERAALLGLKDFWKRHPLNRDSGKQHRKPPLRDPALYVGYNIFSAKSGERLAFGSADWQERLEREGGLRVVVKVRLETVIRIPIIRRKFVRYGPLHSFSFTCRSSTNAVILTLD